MQYVVIQNSTTRPAWLTSVAHWSIIEVVYPYQLCASPMSSTAIDKQLQALLAPWQPRLVILFGSLAKGTATANSDLDIAIKLHRPMSAQRRMELMEQLATAIGRPVDLIDLHEVGEPLLGQILAHGRRLVGARTEWAALMSQHLANKEDFVPLQQEILRRRREAWLRQP